MVARTRDLTMETHGAKSDRVGKRERTARGGRREAKGRGTGREERFDNRDTTYFTCRFLKG